MVELHTRENARRLHAHISMVNRPVTFAFAYKLLNGGDKADDDHVLGNALADHSSQILRGV